MDPTAIYIEPIDQDAEPDDLDASIEDLFDLAAAIAGGSLGGVLVV